MVTIKDYLDYSELAQASYVNGLQVGMKGNSYGVGEDNIFVKADEFTIQQASNFAERYEVKAVYSDTITGFSATLFRDTYTGKKILAIRGTDDITGSDFDDDILQLGIQKTLPGQYESLVGFFESLKSSGKISKSDNLTVVGHSLGGALAQMTTATYKDYVDQTYTFNSPGVKNLSIPNVMEYQGEYYRNYEVLSGGVVTGERISKELYNAYQAFKDNKLQVDNKVINVEAKDGPSKITDLGPDIGSSVEVFINADNNYLYNHSNKTLTDTLSFYNALSSIDSTLSLTQITNFLEEIDKNGVINKDKLDLHQDILNRMADIIEAEKADNLYDTGLNIISKNIKTTISFLTTKSISQLTSKDKANLYALLNLNPFTIEGDLPAYNNIAPNLYSDMYLKKRAEFLYYSLDVEGRYKPLGDDVAAYKDTELGLLLHNSTLSGRSYATDRTTGRVIFDSDKLLSGKVTQKFDWALNGSSYGENYLFGMGGEDTLFGGKAKDYLEGGEGNDRLYGGAGDDTYVAGDGDTIYDSDGIGKVFFEDSELYDGDDATKGHALSGGTQVAKGSNIYRGDGGEYTLIDSTLIFTKDGKTLTIDGYTKESLGITLHNLPDEGSTTTGDGTGNDTTTGNSGDDTLGGNTTNDLTKATPQDDILILTDDNDRMDALAGNDYVEGKGGDDILIGNEGNDILWGGADDDFLYGDAGKDILFGDTGRDYLEGGEGEDLLYGGEGNDILLGGEGADYLDGGSEFDTYVADNGDTLSDSDGAGVVYFKNSDLTGIKTLKDGSSNIYKDKDGFEYQHNGDNLVVTHVSSGESITILEWSKEKNLGIVLQESSDIDVSIDDADAREAAQSMTIEVEILRPLQDDEMLSVDIGYYKPIYKTEYYGDPVYVPESNTPIVTTKTYDKYKDTWSTSVSGGYTPAHTYRPSRQIQTGEEFISIGKVEFTSAGQTASFTYSWKDDKIVEEDQILGSLVAKSSDDGTLLGDAVKVTTIKAGSATIIDDDETQRTDPLVLDLNKDGFISTTSLADSNTYFDITGDGLRERVGWVAPQDGLLVYDKNNNGSIDGIDELFGSKTESGVQELKRLIDSNHDNTINQADELYSRLQVWRDKNGDAIVQEGEITSLKDEGIKSINLNAINTKIEINGNILTEATKYTDTEGNRELIADIQLATDTQDTQLHIEDIPNFTIDESTRELPNIKGTGLVYDAFIKYNTDEAFKSLAKNYAADKELTTTEFESYLESFSGYTSFIATLKERYSLDDDFTMSKSDKETWIVKRFDGESTQRLENYYTTNLDKGSIPTTPLTAASTVTHNKYTTLLEKTQSTFAIQAFYKELFAPTHYDLESDSFIIDDATSFYTNLTQEFNSTTKTIQDKVALAKLIQMQRTGLSIDTGELLNTITNPTTKTLLKETLYGRDVILGSNDDDVVQTDDKKHTILLAEGDDVLQSGKGIDSFYFRRGDGNDLIQDAGGIDRLIFDKGINADDVTIQLLDNKDLIIGLNEDGVAFEELKDKVTIVNYMDAANRVETIEFGDGSKLDFRDVLAQYTPTDADDTLTLSSYSDTIQTLGGNDIIKALAGNDTLEGGKGDDRLEGGVGNDIYIYAQGDGKDTIIESGGYDTLQFKEGIIQDMLTAKLKGSDLLIGIKEEGKGFDELNDFITIKNYTNDDSKVEAIYLDGYQRVDIDSLLNQPTEGDDDLTLGDGDDTVNMLGGNDTVKTNKGNDTISGGRGDDTLEGGKGDDTYIFNLGDGRDTIFDDYSFGYKNLRKDDAGNDTLQLGEGITQDMLIIKYNGPDLIIGIKEDGVAFEALSDTITIKNYTNKNNTIENILLSDGTSVVVAPLTNGTEGSDHLDFSSSTEELAIQGLGGSDYIHTGSGDDNIQGNSGLDTLYGGGGSDILSGGTGSDFLAGGSGDDTYVYNRGDGADMILDDNRPETQDFGTTTLSHVQELLTRIDNSDTAQTDAGNDTLQFGEGITREDISYTISGDDLIISIAGVSGDTITIKNYLNSKNMIENMVLFDGTRIDLFGATQGDDNLVFGDGDITIDALGGNDIVSTSSGDDTITGGSGDDRLEGGLGDDTYIFSRGDGKDTVSDDGGNDTLLFTDGIIQDDLIVKLIGKDLLVALKEDGKSFKELSDVVTFKNHTNAENQLERIRFADGRVIDMSGFDFATEGDDYFVFDNRDVSLNALAGNDQLFTGSGDDILAGGKGADILQGGSGDDTYLFNRGDGNDTITDSSGSDSVVFGSGITQDDLIMKLIGRDLVVALKEDGKSFEELSDVITFKNHTNTDNRLENIIFADGTSLDVTTLDFATEDDDSFIFGNVNTTIDTLGGDDVVVTSGGNDTISGGSGNDMLKSGAGEDILAGGSGNDRLEGGRDGDTYIFNRGDGVDTIYDNYFGYNYQNGLIEFDKDPSSGEMVVKLTGSNLVDTLSSRERQFSDFAKESSDANMAGGIFVKLVGDDLIIAQFDNGKFENASNKIVFHKYISQNGLLEFSQGEVYGDMSMDLIDGMLEINSSSKGSVTFAQNISAGDDILQFGEGITQDDIVYKTIGSDLVFALREGNKSFDELGDKIIIKDYVNSANRVENILFSDGSRFDFDATPVATEGDDNFVFGDEGITVDMLGGSDRLTSGSGDDDITGGRGDDMLQGGEGNDIYRFSRGDGKDTVFDAAGNDKLILGAGVLQSDLLFKQEGDNLLVALKEDGKSFNELSDVVLIQDWFKTKNNIETIDFADGTTMDASKIATMVLGNQLDTLIGNQGAKMLGGAGDDTYIYNKGDFTVIIDDKYRNKEIEVNAGDDTLKFADITSDKITLGTKGDDLIIKIDATHDTYTELKDYVVIRDWQNSNRGIEQIVFGDGEVLSIDKTATYPELEFNERWIKGNYYIYGSEDNIVEPSAEDIALRNGADEIFQSGAGDDTVRAYGGNDYIIGGQGNDTLDGGEGNDTYLFNRGDGVDTITDTQGVDTIKFGTGISQADVMMEHIGNDLVLSLNSDDRLVLKNWLDPQTIENRIELMVTDEGTLAIADLVTPPTQDNDNLEFGDENNHIEALNGDDVIHIGGGDDYLAGNEGNDRLYGGDGNDTISGDSGEDTLYGGEGDDSYRFGRGDGKDIIIEDNFEDWSRTGNDTLVFKAGITADDLILVEDGDDLLVGLKESGKSFEKLSDTIRIKKWATYDDANSQDYARAYYTVENFSFSDGLVWNIDEITAHIGSDVSETIFGFNSNDTLEGKQGDDILEGHLGNDTYIFNRGDGHDTIYDYGRKGDDYSYYDAGNDTLQFGEGITEDELVFVKDNDDVIVYIKEGDKNLTDLQDKIVLKNWFSANNRVENIVLHDGSAVDYIQYLGVEPTAEDDKLIYGYGDDIVDALAGDDVVVDIGGDNYIDGNTGNDNIQSGSGNDTLIGGAGNDTLDGGEGDDRLEGGTGDDTYIFNLGDGHDTISDYADNIVSIDTIVFGQGIVAEDVEFLRLNSDDLTIKIDDDNSLVIQNWFLDENYKIEKINFIDGVVLDSDAVEKQTIYYGDDNNNDMHDSNNGQTIYALAGNDIIYANDGDDKIYSGDGNDTLLGGTGNDYLEGGSGDDTYVFNRGDGVDTVVKLEGNDLLHFGSGITSQDLIIKSDGDNLIVALKEDGVAFADLSDKVILINWYNTNTRVESFSFEDDTNATMNVAAIVSVMGSDENDTIRGTELSDTLNGHIGDDQLYGNQGDDTLLGGTGNDYLEGGAGNDTYIFNRGDGVDTIVDNNSDIFYRDIVEDDYYGEQGNILSQDKIQFGDGIVTLDLIVRRDGDNLIIGLKEDGVDFQDLENKLIITDYDTDQNRIESFEFKNGSMLTLDDIILLANSNAGKIIYGTEGDDYLEGTSDEDTIYAEDGNDTLVGNAGNDRLEGGYGNDTYIYNRGDGQDTIFDAGSYGDYYKEKTVLDTQLEVIAQTSVVVENTSNIFQDTLQFGDGIVRDDLEFQRVGTNLVINIFNDSIVEEPKLSIKTSSISKEIIMPYKSEDTITIENYFSYENTIEIIKLADGSLITQEDILNFTGKVITGTNEDDVLDANQFEHIGDTILIGLDGNDSLYGSYYGNDILIGGKGNDRLEGGFGDDIYIFNRGDGQDYIYDKDINPSDFDSNFDSNGDTILFGEGISIDDIVTDFRFTDSNYGESVIALREHTEAEEIAFYSDSIRIENGPNGISIKTLQFADGSSYNIQEYFGENWGRNYAMPIVLDMNENGVTSTTLEGSNAYFDYDGDGKREHTAWVEKGDALLVADLNGDGVINDGSEQFGEYTQLPDGSFASNGYEALSQYDSNSDGVINKSDNNFNDLLLWSDANSNGKSDSGELVSLRMSGITAIHLNQDGITFDKYFENGNLVTGETLFETPATTGVVRDVWFKYDRNDTLYGENDLYSFNIGDGNQIIDDNDLGSNGIDKLLFGAGITQEQIVMRWDRGSDDLIIGIRSNMYDVTPLSELNDQIHIKNWFNTQGAIESFEFSDGSVLETQSIYEQLLEAREDKELTLKVLHPGDELSGGKFNDILYGESGSELLSGNEGDDYLKGLGGDDYLEGNDGDDVLDGGRGDDSLVGGDGDDIYLYKKGDGRDNILDYNGTDTLLFGDGIIYDDVEFALKDNGLLISFKYDNDLPAEDRDTIFIQNYQDKAFKIENVIFNDGNSFGLEEIMKRKTNQAPIDLSVDQTFTLEDIRVMQDSLQISDADGDKLYYRVSNQPKNGTLTIDEQGVWTYSVEGIYIGDDTATILIDDGYGGTVTKTLNFDAKVSAPTINTATVDLKEDTPVDDTISVTNPVGGALTYEIVTNAANGAFSVNEDGSYRYNPNQDYNGQDSVVIKVTNEYGLSTTSTLTFEIEAVNDAPTVEEIAPINLAEDAAVVSGQVNAHDVDKGAILRYTAPEIAGFTLNSDGSYSFDASDEAYQHLEEGVVETITIPITVLDEYDATAQTDIVIQLTGTNDAPIIEDITPIVTYEDDALVTGTIISSDVDDNATATFTTDATVAGFILNSDGTYGFNPADDAYQSLAKDEVLDITIPISVTDDKGASDTKELYIRVVGTNDAPTVTVESRDLLLQNIRNIEGKVEANDVDGDVLSYSVATQAAHGTVTIDEQGNWHYKAEGSFNGEDSATILVDDGNGGEVTQTLNFTVDGYIYEGEDLVIDEASGNDTLSMTDINKDELSFSRSSDDLQIAVADGGIITLKNYFTNTQAGVETLHTAQGDINLSRDIINNVESNWWHGSFRAKDSQDHLISGTDYNDWLQGDAGNDIILGNNRYDWLRGNEGDDLLIGGDADDRLYGNEGNDNLYGDAGNDLLNGGSGNDALIGGVGHDILIADNGDDLLSGGSGRDRLFGGSGDDTYRFNKGDGADTVYDADDSSWCWWNQKDGGNDTIEFGKGITKDDIVFSTNWRGDLVLEYGEGDTINIQNQFNENNQIEKIELSDGMYITNDDIELVIQQINNYGVEKGMWHIDNNDIKNNQDLMNIVSSAWHE